jgi:hypothetical protein
MACRTIRKLCIDVDRTGDCVGVCLPKPDSWNQQQGIPYVGPMSPRPNTSPPQQPPSWGGGFNQGPKQVPPPAPPVQQQPPVVQPAPALGGLPRTYEPKQGNSLCPANMRCPREDDLCVPDPRNPGPSPAFLCGYPDQYCGGSNMKACPGGNICVRDPRDTW